MAIQLSIASLRLCRTLPCGRWVKMPAIMPFALPGGSGRCLLGAAAMGFAGLNLTIPLKEKALELDFLQPDPLAKAIGAVNTVSFGPKRIAGYNTDGWGALLALQDAGVKIRGKSVLIIGAGGAARAIAYTLEQEGAEISIANRSLERARGAGGPCECYGLLPVRPGKACPSG